jgi:signal transduction histidine kinase
MFILRYSLVLLCNKVQITEINSTPIFDKVNNIVSIITSHRDITQFIKNQQELKENQEHLIKSEKEKNEILEASMKLKDEFLYLITHEFRTPITVVNSALQAIELMYKSEVTERVSKHLATIKQNTNRQLRLVNNLLDITKINSGHIKLNKSYFDIVYVTNAIINSVKLYANQKKVNLYFTSNITKKTVCLDEGKFERIMLNLMSNALKFTPQGKSINVMLSVKKHKNKKIFV